MKKNIFHWPVLLINLPVACLFLVASVHQSIQSAEANSTSKVGAFVSKSSIPDEYLLVWRDEFDNELSDLPDPSRWRYDTEYNRSGWFNNELQYYSAARTENALVSSGTLKLIARLEDSHALPSNAQQNYTSARLFTKGTFEFKYGYVEVRAKLPCSPGAWPAIWLLSAGNLKWPKGGEIDIVEWFGRIFDPHTIQATVHYPSNDGAHRQHEAVKRISSVCGDFHRYQLHWRANSILIGVDDEIYFTYLNPRDGSSTWPFNNSFYLLLNVAVGGDQGGNPSKLPYVMEVDYVRIYQANVESYSGNLALGKHATQSSVLDGGVAARAVDGVTDGNYWLNNSVSHTSAATAQDWWQVDLGELATIDSVRLWTRTDCCADRLSNFYVFASPRDMTGKTLADLLSDPTVKRVSVASLNGSTSIMLPMDGFNGRHVRVQLGGHGFLSLAEVLVGGTSMP